MSVSNLVNGTVEFDECGAAIDPNATYVPIFQTQEQWITIMIPSVLSILGSLSYLITYYIFHKEMIKKESFQLLVWVFLCDGLTAAGSAPGWPADGTFPCWWEGFMTNIFTLAAVMWTVILTWKLYCIVAGIKSFGITYRHHLIAWSIPLFATFIPFIDSTYGAPGEGLGWCWIVDKYDEEGNNLTPEGAGAIWFWVSYYLWLWIAFIIIITLGVMMTLKFSNAHDATRKNFYKAVYSLAGYPLIILITWLPSTFNDFNMYNFPCMEISDDISLFCTIIGTLMGFLDAICFWSTNPRVVNYWVKFAEAGFDYKEYESRRKLKESRDVTGSNASSSNMSRTNSAGSLGRVGSGSIADKGSSGGSKGKGGGRGTQAAKVIVQAPPPEYFAEYGKEVKVTSDDKSISV